MLNMDNIPLRPRQTRYTGRRISVIILADSPAVVLLTYYLR
jgi:hypothetical protein